MAHTRDQLDFKPATRRRSSASKLDKRIVSCDAHYSSRKASQSGIFPEWGDDYPAIRNWSAIRALVAWLST